MKFTFLKTAVLAVTLSMSGWANALLIFSDVSYTANSFTFTVNGNLSVGYDLSNIRVKEFSIRYSDSVWAGLTTNKQNISWSEQVFDGYNIATPTPTNIQSGLGKTGKFTDSVFGYTSSTLDGAVSSGTAPSNKAVTVTFGDAYLNASATSGTFDFFLGTGHADRASNGDVLDNLQSEWLGSYSFNTVSIPEPSTLTILGLGLMALVSRRFRK